ncbi:hypothetical protein [uncultured Maribacter sp.]|uniref:hypothetical protein n=1 Tax=uncultured Maribacter sp. TaxID=431308 RepID=UPI00261DC039|nr:hypothetical protein [uncultured Maribacter sp.]
MSKFLRFSSKLTLSFFALFTLFSCSKDADLLSEYVINENDDLQSLTILTNDSFYMAAGQNTILMDVLNNDNLSDNVNVTIIETSAPLNGIVTINDDNTLTYRAGETTPEETTPEETTPEETTPEETTPEETTPEETTTEETTTEETTPEDDNTQEEQSTTEDTFTYTAEVVDEETGTVTVEEAIVTVSPGPPTEDINSRETLNMGELLAFPGAKGFGQNTTGGRGGNVYHVTNLNDTGSGSLRYGIETVTGARTIVFDVGGEINLYSDITVRKEHGNLTVAGQTAPNPGISIKNYGIDIQSSNVIVRYITLRMGDYQMNNGGIESDCIRIKNFGGGTISNIIIDHCSLSWATDEIFSIAGQGGVADSRIENISFNHNIIGEATNISGYNILYGVNAFNLTFYGNYLSSARERSPLNGYGDNGESSEWINNITYGFETGSIVSFGTNYDLLGSIYKAYANNEPDYEVVGAGANLSSNTIDEGTFYAKDNFKINAPTKNLFNQAAITRINNTPNRYFSNSKINSWYDNINDIESLVLSDTNGNSIYRDAVDTRLIQNYYNESGSIWNGSNPNELPGGWPTKLSTQRSNDYDTDKDGLADEWEINYFGNLNKTANSDENSDGYTNLEEFLHSLTL